MTTHKSKDNSAAAIKATLEGALTSIFGPEDANLAAQEEAKAAARIERLRGALRKGDAKLLRSFVAKPDYELIEQILKRGDADVLAGLLDAGLDVGASGRLKSILRDAVYGGKTNVTQLLIDRGADLNVSWSMGGTLLHLAVETANPAMVQLLIGAGVDPNKPNTLKRTALHDAAEAGHAEIVRLLVGAGATVNFPAPSSLKKTMGNLLAEKSSPLILAAKNGHGEAVKALLEAGADPAAKDDEDRTAYDWARKNKHGPVAELLKGRGGGADSGASVADLLAASESGDAAGVKQALRAGVPIESKDAFAYDHAGGTGGLTALMLAARNGHVNIVRLLLESGANVNALCDDKWNGTRPALTYAAGAGQVEVLRILLDAGATVSRISKEMSGPTALHAAAENGHVEVVQLLLQHGTKPEEKSGGDTPLHRAAAKGHVDVMCALLDAGAKVEVKDRTHRTPLHAAAGGGQIAAARLLIERGASVNAVSKENTPLDAATIVLSSTTIIYGADGKKRIKDQGDPLGVMKLLLEAGADPNLTAKDDAPPILRATNNPDAVRLLLQYKADPSAIGNDGANAVWWAVMYDKPESLGLLLDAGADPNTIARDGTFSALDLALDRGRPACAAMLKKVGARRAKDLQVGKRIAAEKKAKQRQHAREAEESEKKYRAMLPDFSKGAASKLFKDAVKRAAKITGSEPVEIEQITGGFTFKSTKARARELLAEHHDKFLAEGYYFFSCGRSGLMDDDPDLLGLLPTKDKYQVMMVMGTNAANYGKGPVEVIEALKEIEKEQKFSLTHISFDTLEGEWKTPIRNPGRFAKRLYEFCPDIVDQGVGTVAALSKALKRDNRLYFWWD